MKKTYRFNAILLAMVLVIATSAFADNPTINPATPAATSIEQQTAEICNPLDTLAEQQAVNKGVSTALASNSTPIVSKASQQANNHRAMQATAQTLQSANDPINDSMYPVSHAATADVLWMNEAATENADVNQYAASTAISLDNSGAALASANNFNSAANHPADQALKQKHIELETPATIVKK